MKNFKVHAKLHLHYGPRLYDVRLNGITLRELGTLREGLRETQFVGGVRTTLGEQFEKIITEAERKS